MSSSDNNFSANSSPKVSEDFMVNYRLQEESHPPTTTRSTRKSRSRKGKKGMVAERNWTKDEIKSYIRLWKQSNILYNVLLPDYLDKEKKE